MNSAPYQPSSQPMESAELRAAMADDFARLAAGNENKATVIPWLSLHSRSTTSLPYTYVAEPNVAIVLQGSKQVIIGEEVFTYDESHFMLTTIDLPMKSCVMEASEARPYLVMQIKLDLTKVRQYILEYEIPAPPASPNRRGVATGLVTNDLLLAAWRLLGLLDKPRHAGVLSDVVLREIVYLLLHSEQGGRLWQIAMMGSQTNRIQKVIQWLRHHYADSVRAEELAEMAAMSVSSLQHLFREVTSLTPLQFQKQLRLHEARRLMLVEDLDAGVAALRVGYESASQFGREYNRMFGQSPMRDIKQLRASLPAATAVLEPA